MAIGGHYIANPNKALLWMKKNPANGYSKYAICLHGFIHVSWYRISEPSTVWSTNPSKWPYSCIVCSPQIWAPELKEADHWLFGVLANWRWCKWTFVHPLSQLLLAKPTKIQKIIGGFIAAHPTGQIHREIRVDLRFRELSSPRENLGRSFFWRNFMARTLKRFFR